MAGFKALVLREAPGGGAPTAALETADDAALPDGDVTVAVQWSTLNYKDGMILQGQGRLVRSYPHVPGVDFSGTVEQSAHPDFRPGDPVVLTGWRVGETRWGGYAGRARVPGDWLVKLPAAISPRHAMAIGTAGFTAMLALQALERHGLAPNGPLGGDVLVTGAAGGVGSVALALLARAGYRAVASSGRAEQEAEYLRALGAAEIIPRAVLAEGGKRPLEAERWAGAIDAAGGRTLVAILAQLRNRAAVAACGLAAGADLPGASVIPFLLRGVSLLGIDSVMAPVNERRAAWDRLARDLAPALLDRMTEVVPLEAVASHAGRILAGQTRGRVVVEIGG